jgi:hypothetical protein
MQMQFTKYNLKQKAQIDDSCACLLGQSHQVHKGIS